MFKDYFSTIRHQNVFTLIKTGGVKIYTHNFIILAAHFDALRPKMHAKYERYKEHLTYVAIKATVKAFKTAVARNKIKRQVRNLVYDFLKHYPSKQHAFIIIIPKSTNNTKKFSDIKSDLFFGLRKVFKMINTK